VWWKGIGVAAPQPREEVDQVVVEFSADPLAKVGKREYPQLYESKVDACHLVADGYPGIERMLDILDRDPARLESVHELVKKEPPQYGADE
jgi:hypothetical protein